MKNQVKLILWQLSKESDYISANELAGKLNISRETIFRYLDEVHDYLEMHNYTLIRKAASGIKINAVDERLLNLLKKEDTPVTINYNEERFYCALYLLISEEDNLHISELSEIFHVSRPTIYKLLESINNWLLQYGCDLSISREGVKLQSGEKRLRLLILSWCSEVNTFLQSMPEDYQDVYKLNKSRNLLFNENTLSSINDALRAIKRFTKLDFSITDQEWLSQIINIAIQRMRENNTITMPESRLKIIDLLDKDHKIINFIKDTFIQLVDVHLLENELIYVYSLILNSSPLLSQGLNDLLFIDEDLINKLKYYVNQKLNIKNNSIASFIDNFKVLLAKEIIVQINANYRVNMDYQRKIINSYTNIKKIVEDIVEMVSDYYVIMNQEIFSYNLSFILMLMVEESKEKLNIVFFNDCNSVEMLYLHRMFIKYLNFVHIIHATQDANDIKECDLIITTIPHYVHEDYEVIVITKNIKDIEVSDLMLKTHRLFESINHERLLKKS